MKVYLEQEALKLLKDLKKFFSENRKIFLFGNSLIKNINLNNVKMDNYENLYYLENNINDLYDFCVYLTENQENAVTSFLRYDKSVRSFELQIKPELESIILEIDNQRL